MTTFTKIDAVLPDFIKALDAQSEAHYRAHLPALWEQGHAPKHSAEKGKKFVRIVQAGPGQRSAFCFLDAEGNILKADGWARPAKGIRGSIFDPNFSIGKGVTLYGAAYRYR